MNIKHNGGERLMNKL